MNTLYLIVTFFFTTWMSTYVVYLSYLMARDRLFNKYRSIKELFTRINHSLVFRLFMSWFIFIVLLIFVLSLTSGITMLTWTLAIIIIMPVALFFVAAVFVRAVFVFPYIVFGMHTLSEALKRSLQRITYRKAMKYSLVIILCGLIMTFSGMTVGVLAKALSMGVPEFQIILNQLISVVLNSYFLCFAVSTMSVLYYRNEKTIVDEGNIPLEDHLIEDL